MTDIPNKMDDNVRAGLNAAISVDATNIQGFLYGNSHVIRDVLSPPEDQELWRETGDNYDTLHFMMMDEIERIRFLRRLSAFLEAAGFVLAQANTFLSETPSEFERMCSK